MWPKWPDWPVMLSRQLKEKPVKRCVSWLILAFFSSEQVGKCFRLQKFWTRLTQCTPWGFNLDQKFLRQNLFSYLFGAKKVRISQEKHLLTGFPLNYQPISASMQCAPCGQIGQYWLAGSSKRNPLRDVFLNHDSDLFCIIVRRKKISSSELLVKVKNTKSAQ